MTRRTELERALLVMETLDSAGQMHFLRETAMQSKGTFKTPRLGGMQHEKIARIHAIGVRGRAQNMNEAISDWCRSARRQITIYNRLDQAERILRSEGPISEADLRTASDFILDYSKCAGSRLIAQSMLTAVDNAAAA